MSTTTTTSRTTQPAHTSMPLKPSYPIDLPALSSLASSSSATLPSATAPTLRSLYPRAARAFLQRDIALTHSLLSSAFAILHPPPSLLPDSLDSQRRKWDILRITLESTVYSAPPPSNAANPKASLPKTLRENLMLAPPLLTREMATRSMRLFTPQLPGLQPKAAYLPAQIVITLALASIKLECADVARDLLEDWLAQREQVEHVRLDAAGYEKVVDLYCLHVLPRLGDWDLAGDYLRYNEELPPDSKHRLHNALEELHRANAAVQQVYSASKLPSPTSSISSTPSTTTPTPTRSPSPSPSTSSSSSVDTTSTHTVVPRTPRPNAKQTPNGLSALTPTSSSASLNGNAHPHANGSAVYSSSRKQQSTRPDTTAKVKPSAPATHGALEVASKRTASRSRETPRGTLSSRPASAAATAASGNEILTLVRAYLRQNLTTSRLVFLVLLVVFPLLSFALRLRRRRRLVLRGAGAGAGAAATMGKVSGSVTSLSTGSGSGVVDEARRRLRERQAGSNIVTAIWREIMRAVSDTVRMAGSGLV